MPAANGACWLQTGRAGGNRGVPAVIGACLLLSFYRAIPVYTGLDREIKLSRLFCVRSAFRARKHLEKICRNSCPKTLRKIPTMHRTLTNSLQSPCFLHFVVYFCIPHNEQQELHQDEDDIRTFRRTGLTRWGRIVPKQFDSRLLRQNPKSHPSCACMRDDVMRISAGVEMLELFLSEDR